MTAERFSVLNIESQPVKIEIHEGALQKTIKMGLPSENPDAPIKSLDASLLLINEEPDRTWCLRVEDDKHVYAVKRLAPYIQGDSPQMIFDGYMLHILLQVRPKLYTYITYAMQGLKLSHPMQKYMVSSNGLPPMLDRSSGFVKLINAVPAIEGQDFLMEK